jgi:hypothetical protein
MNWYLQTAAPSNFSDDVMNVNFLNTDTGFVVGNSQFYRTTNAGEVTGIIDETESNQVQFFPNPVTNLITFNFPVTEQWHSIAIFSADCKLVFNDNTNQSQLELRTDAFPNGTYQFSISTAGRIQTGKFVVTHL